MGERLPYIDFLKVVACIAVINLHCTSPWVTNFLGTPLWFIAMLDAIFTHLAVPMFFMLAGAVIPQRTIVLREHYKKVLIRYILPTIACLVFYKILGVVLLGHTTFFEGVFYSIERNPGFHLWFMWVYIGYMLVMPALAAIAKDDGARTVFFYVGFIYTFIVPLLSSAFEIRFPVTNVLFTVYGFYFIAGNHLAVMKKQFDPKLLLKILAAMSVITYAFATLSSHGDTTYTAKFLTANSMLIFINTSLVFLIFKSHITSYNTIISFLSKHTFNIYLLHIDFFLKPFSFLAFPMVNMKGLLGSIFFTTPVTFILCLATSCTLVAAKTLLHRKFFRKDMA
ncbi:acyltransferase [Nitratidesulfovibrio termitidis]|uniref:acyltransferase n=1 Tax=Nitratidesulfovibrio termitidis TaxID=42252 RepID=UPI000414ECC5|nr:acyltransferase [Nitratidesulfovibrio termitidis]